MAWSEERKQKHRLAMKGVVNSGQFQKGHTPWTKLNKGKFGTSRKGTKLSLEWRQKLSAAKKGKDIPWLRTPEVIAKFRLKKLGSANPSWKGGITGKRAVSMNKRVYKNFRVAVKQRDGYKCLECGASENLHVDHIKPFALFPELELDLDNARTLCAPCHYKTDTFGGRKIYKIEQIQNV